MSGLAELGNLWHTIQAWLFPVLEDELGELDDQHREFVAVCEFCAPREHLATYRWVGKGWIAQGPPGTVQGIHRQGRVGLPNCLVEIPGFQQLVVRGLYWAASREPKDP